MHRGTRDLPGRPELIVVPLFGRGSSAKNNYDERPMRILSYKVPADPIKGPWKAEGISEDLHVAHNFYPADVDGDGKLDLLVASYEGVSLFKRSPQGKWSREPIGTGNQDNKSGSRGASEGMHCRHGGGNHLRGGPAVEPDRDRLCRAHRTRRPMPYPGERRA